MLRVLNELLQKFFCHDYNFFNSDYHLKSYIVGLKKYLKKMPDFNNLDSINIINDKSSVLPLGCNFKKINLQEKQNKIPIILWNHRWEYDKNPVDFFKALYKMQEKGLDFEVVVLGENFRQIPEEFEV